MMASSCTTRRPAAARHSSSSMSSPGIIAVGSRSCGISGGVTAQSHMRRLASPQAYGQDRATDDILAILDHLGIAKAHICGLSMGAFATLHFGFRYPERAISLCVAGCGSGAEPDTRQRFQADAGATADELREKGMDYVAERYAYGPTRVQFAAKDPRGFAEF